MGIRAFCVHGHFYQPPREDPLTGKIPREPGAAPFHDWNERIFSECYQPNADQGNFERISFNIGPTLFDWMEKYHPRTAQKIIDQDRNNVLRYQVGNAMAQAYNHSILPLSTRRDKETQIVWGIADFEHRFARKPKGMWLPETAVDHETLEVMADCGIEYTILAPWQSIRPLLSTGHPYQVHLSGGRKMTVFFYNQDLSTRISFDPGATVNADDFVINLLAPKYRSTILQVDEPQIHMIASDGELYGHHQPFRDKFLSYLLDGALSSRDLLASFPELWLKYFPPHESIQIRDNSSWSCHHGVVRWMGECGCTAHSEWKAPLRKGLNQLADWLDMTYIENTQMLAIDPWQLRNEYIHIILGETRLEDMVNSIARKRLTEEEIWRTGLLLEAQWERQRMFTSCGWFFEDFDRIEPKNNVAYATRAVWLTRQATGIDLAPQTRNLLRRVKSHRTGLTAEMVFTSILAKVQTSLTGS